VRRPDYRVSRGHPEEQLVPEGRDDRMALTLRLVVNRCIYGVDINPLAVELAKVSLWLATLSKNEPFTFLDHRLKCGNSLIGAGRLEYATYPAGNIDAPARDQWSCWKRDNVSGDVRKALNALHRFVIKEAREKKAGVPPLSFGEPPHMETVTAHASRILDEIERMPASRGCAACSTTGAPSGSGSWTATPPSRMYPLHTTGKCTAGAYSRAGRRSWKRSIAVGGTQQP